MRNFANKIWNAYRLVMGWSVGENQIQSERNSTAIKWFDHLLSQSIVTINDHFDKFRISDALMLLYKLFWDDFCAWYLEIIKPEPGGTMDKETYEATKVFFDKLLRLLHPYMPFITEELWHNLQKRGEEDSIMITLQPASKEYSSAYISNFEQVKQAIVNIRSIRQSKAISPKNPLELYLNGGISAELYPIITKMANISEIKELESKAKDDSGSSFMVDTIEFFIPLGNMINVEDEIGKIESEITHLTGFLATVNKKLLNEKFVESAPKAVVDVEYKKKSDAETKIEKLTQTKNGLLKR